MANDTRASLGMLTSVRPLLCLGGIVLLGSWFARGQADLLTRDQVQPRTLNNTGPILPLDPATLRLEKLDSVDRTNLPGGGQPVDVLPVVANERGIDSGKARVPDREPRSGTRGKPVADAGDDQIAVVGRQVTLNGGRSEPRGGIGYRWVQVAGPRVRLKLEDGPFLSFVPAAPGIYRFALLVALASQVSEPDETTISVGALASAVPGAGTREAVASVVEEDSLDQVARRALTLVHPKPDIVEDLASTFEEVATRMDLYESYSSMFQELSRRLDTTIPAQPARRKLWLERVFGPLTQNLIPLMQAEGLDLSRPEGQSTPLTLPQRALLSEQFRLIAEGFRAARKEIVRTTKPTANHGSTE